MVKVLFVCTGNICRSPTAHAVFRHMAKEAGISVIVESAGTHAYHVGQPSDRRSSAVAKLRGYDMSDIRARQVRHSDFEEFDLILCMDQGHVLTLQRHAPSHLHHKIKLFDARDVGDPYYGGDQGFEDVLDQIEHACKQLLKNLKN